MSEIETARRKLSSLWLILALQRLFFDNQLAVMKFDLCETCKRCLHNEVLLYSKVFRTFCVLQSKIVPCQQLFYVLSLKSWCQTLDERVQNGILVFPSWIPRFPVNDVGTARHLYTVIWLKTRWTRARHWSANKTLLCSVFPHQQIS